MNELFNEILSDLEKTKIEQFCNDTVALGAVKKVILAGIYYNGTLQADKKPDSTRNFMLGEISNAIIQTTVSDEQLGQMARATYTAINAIENSFRQLSTITTEKEGTKSNTKNPAK